MSGDIIRPKDRDAVIQSLGAGVVPRRGHHHIQVGRHGEVEALLKDIDRIADGGSAIRFVIGQYGAGKSFFLQVIRAIGLERKLVCCNADLTPERRLYSTGGHARSLFAELSRNFSTRTKPDGAALPSVVEKFVASAMSEAGSKSVPTSVVIQERLAVLLEMVGGYDFAQVIDAYWRAHDQGDEELKANALRWLRGEFTAKTDARKTLGVRTIIDDENVYDQLKLMGKFIRLAGYAGLFVCLDEMVNLYKMANGRARNTNYEQILRILNDCLQGTVEGLGFLLAGTPEFLTDTRRGLYSYEALQSRLAENSFAVGNLVDLSGPVIRLASLTPEDLYVLLGKLRHVYASGNRDAYLLDDDGLKAFMQHCSGRIGDAYFRTPRNTIKEFMHLLAILDQNRAMDWQAVLGHLSVAAEENPDLAPLPEDAETEDGPAPSSKDDDALASFQL